MNQRISVRSTSRLWEGIFNFQGEIWKGRTEAYTREHAFNKLIEGISKKYQITRRRMGNYFLHKPNSFQLREVK